MTTLMKDAQPKAYTFAKKKEELFEIGIVPIEGGLRISGTPATDGWAAAKARQLLDNNSCFFTNDLRQLYH